MSNEISGARMRDAIISGANLISSQRQQVDALNVFPVPDGDTGTNMSMTSGAAKRELAVMEDDCTVSEAAGTAAAALLRGARGNSGVILSLLFRGIAKGLTGCETAGAADLARAMRLGVESAYKAVMRPTEGTILTVARKMAEYCEAQPLAEMEFLPLWDGMLAAGEQALAETPEQLPTLKKAGVVDAGGKGLMVILAGMGQVLHGGEMAADRQEEPAAPSQLENHLRDAAAEYEGEITFTYCTEFIVVKDPGKADAAALRAYLESIGDCIVVVEDDEIIKIHVHTDNPGCAFQKGLEMGYLINMKVDNMREQHKTKKAAAAKAAPVLPGFEYQPVDPANDFGFVAVAAGQGLHQLFQDLGVQNVVSGGQTMNPSTDEILSAIHATPAKTVFVLPNNKNIIMAAEQAIPLADRSVMVLPTSTIPQGVSAMLAFDPSAGAEENFITMQKAAEHVSTGLVTYVARDSDYDGQTIRAGQILGLENGKLTQVESDLGKTVYKLCKSLLRRHKNCPEIFLTLIYGEDVQQEEAEELETFLREKLPDEVEISLINGGQPVYFYMISVE